jgi:hypothetical protein
MGDAPFSNPLSALTEVRSSSTHNLGVFAKIPIPRQTVWWRVRLCDLIHVRRGHLEALGGSARSARADSFVTAILEFGYYIAKFDTLFFIPDDGRYVNHSFEPNSAVCPDSDGLCSYALCDIAAGEEILEDYTRYDNCPWAKLYGEFGRAIGC